MAGEQRHPREARGRQRDDPALRGPRAAADDLRGGHVTDRTDPAADGHRNASWACRGSPFDDAGQLLLSEAAACSKCCVSAADTRSGTRRTHRLEDRQMSVGDGMAVGPGRSDRDVRAQERFERAPDPLECAVPGEVDDVAVERRIRRRLAERVPVPRGRAHPFEQVGKKCVVGIAEPRECERRRMGLEDRAYLEGLEQLGGVRQAHPSTTEGGGFHDAEGLEVAEGLTYRALAGPELARDTCFHDARPGWVSAVEDRLQQASLDLVG